MSKIIILRLSSKNILLLLDSAIGCTLEHSRSPKVVGGQMLVGCKTVRKHDCICTTNKQNITFGLNTSLEVIINGIRPVIFFFIKIQKKFTINNYGG